MGADYFSTSSSLPHDINFRRVDLRPNAHDALTKLIDEQVIENVHQYLSETCMLDEFDRDIFEGTSLTGLDADDFDCYDDIPLSTDDVATMLAHAYEATDGRDCTLTYINNVPHVITGGMSWGDEPTNAFPYVELLGVSGVFDSPIVEPGTIVVPSRASELIEMHASRLPNHDASKAGLLELAKVIASMRDDLLMSDEAQRVFDGLILNKHAPTTRDDA